MAQHLRIGSVINYGSTYTNAEVTNITAMYLEIEYVDPGTQQTVIRLISWAGASTNVVVVSD